MKHLNCSPRCAMSVAAMVGACCMPLLMSGCDRTQSKSTEETKKVVDTPEGKKVITEKQETKTTTQGK